MMFICRRMFAALVVGAVTVSAAAQSAFLTVGDWSMVPIQNTSTNQVTGLLAVKHANATTGDNLSVVAYRKSSNGTWTSQTWLDGPSAAVAWLGTQGETASFDQIDEAPLPVSVPSQTPLTLVAGVIEGDPAEEIVSDPVVGPSAFAMLVSAGYPAADVPTPGDHDEGDPADIYPCIENAFLDATILVFGTEFAQSGTAFSSSISAACSDCLAVSITLTSAWGTWSCGPWVPDSVTPGPISSGACRDSCYYERTVTRSRMKVSFIRRSDCSFTLTTLTQTESGIQKGSCILDLTPADCARGVLPCPATPDCDMSSHNCAAGPDSGTTRSGWQ
jgi:hypothetical protein